jgi:hypothetical protein
MAGELITLPLRLTGRAARLWWRTAEEAVSLSRGAAGYVIERVRPTGPPSPPVAPAASAAPEPVAPQPAEPGPLTQPGATTRPRPAVAVQEPAHVSEEPELVEELAEPGAEDGAGAELHIREPWEGYRRLSAPEVTAKLSGASAAVLAAVQLYESSTRARQTVLAAAAHQLRTQS